MFAVASLHHDNYIVMHGNLWTLSIVFHLIAISSSYFFMNEFFMQMQRPLNQLYSCKSNASKEGSLSDYLTSIQPWLSEIRRQLNAGKVWKRQDAIYNNKRQTLATLKDNSELSPRGAFLSAIFSILIGQTQQMKSFTKGNDKN